MNWVIIIAGLLPLWGALFIAFSNMKPLSDEEVLNALKEPNKETILELDLTEERPVGEEKAGLFSGILGKLNKNEDSEQAPVEPGFDDPPRIEEQTITSISSIGPPKGIRKLWGAAMILL